MTIHSYNYALFLHPFCILFEFFFGFLTAMHKRHPSGKQDRALPHPDIGVAMFCWDG